MSTGRQNRNRESLELLKENLSAARTGGDPHEICLAAAKLGLVYYQIDRTSEGKKHLFEAEQIAKESGDYQLHTRFLGIQTLAYQVSNQLPSAFQTAQEIEKLADGANDRVTLCDALASQGQILIESGNEIKSIEKFNRALELAIELGDKRRKMNVLGALGHYSLTIASTDQAKTYFQQAHDLALELEDQISEIGFKGNLATVLEWKQDFSEAEKLFNEALEGLEEVGDQTAQLQALYHLAQISRKRQNDQKLIDYAERGVHLAQKAEEFAFSLAFYELLIAAYAHVGQTDQALTITNNAAEAARLSGDWEKEVGLLMTLAANKMLTEDYEEAIELYQNAQRVARKLNHHDKEAFIIGRIGVAMAELGRLAEAAHHHKIAIKVAGEMNLKALEAEQLTMLSLVFRDLDDLAKAKDLAKQALAIYEETEAQTDAEKVEQLISEIDAGMKS